MFVFFRPLTANLTLGFGEYDFNRSRRLYYVCEYYCEREPWEKLTLTTGEGAEDYKIIVAFAERTAGSIPPILRENSDDGTYPLGIANYRSDTLFFTHYITCEELDLIMDHDRRGHVPTEITIEFRLGELEATSGDPKWDTQNKKSLLISSVRVNFSRDTGVNEKSITPIQRSPMEKFIEKYAIAIAFFFGGLTIWLCRR